MPRQEWGMDSVFLSDCFCICWHEMQLGKNELHFLRPVLGVCYSFSSVALRPHSFAVSANASMPRQEWGMDAVFLSDCEVCIPPKSGSARMSRISYVRFLGVCFSFSSEALRPHSCRCFSERIHAPARMGHGFCVPFRMVPLLQARNSARSSSQAPEVPSADALQIQEDTV